MNLIKFLPFSRSGVVRGRVVTSMGSGLVGVRVSTTKPLEGFTLTRENGWFELLVNGGGAVTLSFGRSPFKHTSYVVYVPWNEVCSFSINPYNMIDLFLSFFFFHNL